MMEVGDARLDRIPTGIPGLDTILQGGLVPGGLYLVRGQPGSGKTIFSNQWIFAHATSGGQALYLTMLSETVSRLIQYLRVFPFFQPNHVGQAIQYLSGSAVTQDAELSGLLTLIRQTMLVQQTTVLVLDGLVTVEAMQPQNALAIKRFIRQLQVLMESTGCTGLVLLEEQRTPTPFDSVVDGIIDLHDQMVDGLPSRALTVVKMRGTSYLRGTHPLTVSDTGITVYPRLDTLFTAPPAMAAMPTVQIGIPALDTMLRGGVPATTATLVCGPSGSGKTLLGWQFLQAGAEQGQPGLYVSLTEPPGSVEARMRQAFPRPDVPDAAPIVLHRHAWGSTQRDILGHQILEQIHSHQIQRVVLDGLPPTTDPMTAAADRLLLAALRTALQQAGVTSIWTVTYPATLSPQIVLPAPDLVMVVDAVLTIRFVDHPPAMQRLLTVVKVPHGAAHPATGQLILTSTGLSLQTVGTATPIT